MGIFTFYYTAAAGRQGSYERERGSPRQQQQQQQSTHLQLYDYDGSGYDNLLPTEQLRPEKTLEYNFQFCFMIAGGEATTKILWGLERERERKKKRNGKNKIISFVLCCCCCGCESSEIWFLWLLQSFMVMWKISCRRFHLPLRYRCEMCCHYSNKGIGILF